MYPFRIGSFTHVRSERQMVKDARWCGSCFLRRHQRHHQVSSHVFQSGKVQIASQVLRVQNLDVREVDAYNFSSRLIQPTSFSMVPAARLPLVEQTPVVWCPARRRGRALPRQLLSSSCYRGVTQLNRRSSKSPFVQLVYYQCVNEVEVTLYL